MSDQLEPEDYEMLLEDALAVLTGFYEGDPTAKKEVKSVIPIILREFERHKSMFKAGAAEVERMSMLANDALRDVRRCRETLRAIANTHDSAQQRDIARMALRGDYWGKP